MKPAKLLFVAGAITVYFAFPAYRYYLIGSWVAYKIASSKPGKYHVVPKESLLYNKVLGGDKVERIPSR